MNYLNVFKAFLLTVFVGLIMWGIIELASYAARHDKEGLIYWAAAAWVFFHAWITIYFKFFRGK